MTGNKASTLAASSQFFEIARRELKSLKVNIGSFVCPCSAVFSLWSSMCFAADFSWEPQVRTTMRLEDNVRGASRDAEAAWGFDTGGSLALKAESAQFLSTLVPRFNFRRFAVGENLDADEYGAFSNSKWQHENVLAGLAFSYARDSTLVSEATDTGRVDEVKDRDTVTIQPSLQYVFSDRLMYDASIYYSDVAYLDAGSTGLIDYRYILGASGLTYEVRDDLEGTVTLSVSDFNVPEIESSTRSYSAKAGLKWHWDNSLTLQGAVGWMQSDIEFLEVACLIPANNCPTPFIVRKTADATNGGPIASAGFEKLFENTKVAFDYDREVSPSGRGSQSSSDRLALNVIRNVSSRLNLLLDALYEMRSAQAEGLGSGFAARDLNRDYYEGKASFRYYLTKEWVLGGTYRFGYRKSTNIGSPDTATTNSMYFTVEYIGVAHSF